MDAASQRFAASQTRALTGAWATVRAEVFGNRRPADRALAEFFRKHPEYGGRDRRLIGDMVHGLFRWWGWLGPRVPDPAEAASPDWARALLAVGLLEDAPLPIEAHWAAQAGSDPGALRTQPDRAARLAALFGTAPADFVPAQLIPDWVPAQIDCPRPLPELIDWLQRRAPLWLRVQAANVAAVVAELSVAGLAPSAHARLTGALRLDGARVNLQTLAAYREGRVEVQDVSSQAVVAACGAKAGQRWLDLCAGAGGKALALALAVGPNGQVVATDVREDALEALAQRARRAGLKHVATRRSTRAGDLFDGVLVDAPCSGSGTWRRSPWARWQLQAEDVARYASQQRELLVQGAEGVRPGGLLVYATCSLFRAENRDVVTSFLASHGAFHLEPFTHPLTGVDTNGAVQFWPWDADGDALFVARLRRVD